MNLKAWSMATILLPLWHPTAVMRRTPAAPTDELNDPPKSRIYLSGLTLYPLLSLSSFPIPLELPHELAPAKPVVVGDGLGDNKLASAEVYSPP